MGSNRNKRQKPPARESGKAALPGGEGGVAEGDSRADPSSAWDAARELPDCLPGLDIVAGLTRVMGDRVCYRWMLALFAQDYTDYAERIQQAIGVGEVRRALELVHGLKGVAGNLGALELFLLARELEQSLRHHQAERWPFLLEQMRIALSQVVGAIRSYLAMAAAAGAPLDPGGCAGRREQDKLRDKLTEHLVWLEAHDLRAVTDWPELAGALQSVLDEESLTELTAGIMRLEFEQIAQACREVLERLPA